MKKLVHGIGVLDLIGAHYPKHFLTWRNMLARCYTKEVLDKRPTYKGCSVCKEWRIFSNFKSWMDTQDYTDKCLDKDILVFGNKIYSPDTCIFVSNEINTLITTRKTRDLPIGISHTPSGKYSVRIEVNTKSIILGTYTTVEEAHKTYCKKKSAIIKEVAENQEPRLKLALLKLATNLLTLGVTNEFTTRIL